MYNIVLLDELARFTKFLIACAKDTKAWSKEALCDLDAIADLNRNIFYHKVTDVDIATFLLKMYAKYDLDVEKIKEAQPFKSLVGVKENGKSVKRKHSGVCYRTHR